MFEFYAVAFGLILLAFGFVLYPLLRKSAADSQAEAGFDRQTANVELFKQRQQELDAALASGELESQQYQLLITELQRRLLDEASRPAVETAVDRRPPLAVIAMILVVIAVSSVLFYHHTGAKADWQIAELLQSARERVAGGADITAQRKQLLGLLEQRLQQRPEEGFYWMLRGNLELEQGDFSAAALTFEHMVTMFPADPLIMSQALEAKYLQAGRKLNAEATALAQRILSLDVNNVRTLSLLGIDAFENQQYVAAIDYWQRLLPMVGPFSPNGKMISQGIEQARKLLVAQGGKLPEPVATTAASVQVDVALGDNVNADPAASVFVYARAANGPRMPLAVQRLAVADLPARVTLDDSMAMAPGMNLSSAEQIEIVARISKNGIANRGSGDIEGSKGPLKLSAVKQPVTITIDQVLP